VGFLDRVVAAPIILRCQISAHENRPTARPTVIEVIVQCCRDASRFIAKMLRPTTSQATARRFQPQRALYLRVLAIYLPITDSLFGGGSLPHFRAQELAAETVLDQPTRTSPALFIEHRASTMSRAR
jgi:hypothetical protein